MLYIVEKTFPIAGHSDKDPGAVYNGRVEAKETQKARSLFAKFFPKGQSQIILDKDWESNRELQRRIKPGAGSVLLDFHFNSGSPQSSGTECFVSHKDFLNSQSLSYRMARDICNQTALILGIMNRGVKSEQATRHKRLGILHLGAGCSALWEICFISSTTDMEKWDLRQQELIKSIASIVQKYDDML